MRDSHGLRYSLLMHLVLLILVIFGLPAFFDAKREEEPAVVTVELLPVTGITNIKPQAKKSTLDVEQPKTPPKPTPQEKAEAAKPTSASKADSAPPPPEKEAVAEEKPKEKEAPLPKEDKPKPKAEKKKTEEEKPEKKKKPDEDMDAILKSVANAAKSDAKEKPNKKKPTPAQPAPQNQAEESETPNNSTKYNSDLPLSMSERDAIISQIQKCWSVPAGAKDAYTLVVTVSATFNQDGSLVSVALAKDQGRYASDSFFRAAADSAIRAVKRCTPLKGVPVDRYGSWKEIEMTFDPKDALF